MTRVRLRGRLICDAGDIALVERLLPDHVRLTRAEPGCLRFDVVRAEGVAAEYAVDELFADATAFDAHRARAAASVWGRATAHIRRDYMVETVGADALDQTGLAIK